MPGKRGHPTGRSRDRALKVSADDAEVVRLRTLGFTQLEIAEQLGVARSTVRDRMNRAIDRLPRLDADLWRRQQLDEIRYLKTKLRAIVDDPPFVVSAGKATEVLDAAQVTNAATGYLKLLDREAKLLGLDAPVQQTMTVIDDRALTEAIADLERKIANTVDVEPVAITDGVVVDGRVEGADGDGLPGTGGEVSGAEGGAGQAPGADAEPVVLPSPGL